MSKISLNGKWNLTGVSPDNEYMELYGNVPGNTLGAILGNMQGFDVFYRDNAEQVQKYENYNWIYTKNFEIKEIGKKLELVFERLDTYCDVLLNGQTVGNTANGFIEYRFDISNFVKIGENTVEVRLYSPVIKAKGTYHVSL